MQFRSIGCSHLQNECQLHYHTADSALTSGCSFLGQHIWIKIRIMLAILGICMKSETFSAARRSMLIHISGLQMVDLGTLSYGVVTGQAGWRRGLRWHRLWSRLSASVGWRCTWFFVSPTCLRILCGVIFARRASSRVVWTKHSPVSFSCSLHLFVPRKLNTPLLLFWDLGVRFLWSGIVFPLSWSAKTLFWPFWPYSRPGACQTVPAVPDLLALP